MKEIIGLFWHICLFKKGPDAVPTAGVLVQLVLIVYLLTSVFAVFFTPDYPFTIVGSVVFVVCLLVLSLSVVWMLLWFKGVAQRFLPTALALMGTDIILTFCSLPLMLALARFDGEGLENVFGVLLLLLMGWSMAITGFILHRAMNISLTQGVAIALCIMLLNNFGGQLFLPPTSNG